MNKKILIIMAFLITLSVLLLIIDKSNIFETKIGTKERENIQTNNNYKINLTAKEKKWIAEHPVIRVASDSDWQPVEYRGNDGKYHGIAIDYLVIIEQMLGVHFEIQTNDTWAELIEKSKKKEIDMFSCIADTKNRREYLIFTEPFLYSPAVIFTRMETSYIADLSLLNGKKVGVVKDYAVHEWIVANYPKIVAVPYDNVTAGLNGLKRGEVDAFVDNILVTSNIIAQNKMTEIKVSGETDYVFELGYGIRNDWPELANILEKAVAAIPQEQKTNIDRKWVTIQYDKSFNYASLWQVIGIALVIVIFFALWIGRLEQEVQRRKESEIQLKTALMEKEVLLREVHHRVKNNLNTISNLLYFQSSNIKDETALEAFKDSQNRVLAMARVHEHLYNSWTMNQVDMTAYLNDLIVELSQTYNNVKIKSEFDSFGLILDIDQAVPCGLLINEIVTNAIKHGFVRRENYNENEINIKFSVKGEEYTLQISDNGIGMRQGIRIEELNSLGLKLITMLVRQLLGKMDIQSTPGNGTVFTIVFKAQSSVDKV